MNPKRISRYFVLLFVLLSIGTGNPTKAAPVPPKLVVNHDTRECAEIFGGDECMDCFPPEGWEELGWAYDVECPAGYTFTEVDYHCSHFKNQFCCSEDHSGASGDCEDLVINNRSDQCAFVEDINTCSLPRNWKARTARSSTSDWVCPSKYDWVDELACLAEGDLKADSGGFPLRCSSAALVGLVIPVGMLAFLRRKQRITP